MAVDIPRVNESLVTGTLKRCKCPILHPAVAVSAALFLLAALLRAWLQWIGPFPGDRYAARHFSMPWTETAVMRHITSFYSLLGTPLGAGLLIFVAACALSFRADRATAYGLIVACLVIPLNVLMKLISGPTPLWSETHHVGNNFPSGHVTFVTTVVGYLGWVSARRPQPVGLMLALLVIGGMGPARVLSGAHFVSDVVAGYLVGSAVLALAIAVAYRVPTGETQSA